MLPPSPSRIQRLPPGPAQPQPLALGRGFQPLGGNSMKGGPGLWSSKPCASDVFLAHHVVKC